MVSDLNIGAHGFSSPVPPEASGRGGDHPLTGGGKLRPLRNRSVKAKRQIKSNSEDLEFNLLCFRTHLLPCGSRQTRKLAVGNQFKVLVQLTAVHARWLV
ncbi:hypothetical protein LWI28_014687 [Acer negundo]|uniref:Uncharacterized protein n=1 Tax=Acer negundo TaxID=4023 RepID=A0AAD5IZF8_ACENE|nr:hypothetical protein LWI28_014687 [Acer negundo]